MIFLLSLSSPWINLFGLVCCSIPTAVYITSGLSEPWVWGAAIVPSNFGRSVNHLTIRGGVNYAQHITTGLPRIFRPSSAGSVNIYPAWIPGQRLQKDKLFFPLSLAPLCLEQWSWFLFRCYMLLSAALFLHLPANALWWSQYSWFANVSFLDQSGFGEFSKSMFLSIFWRCCSCCCWTVCIFCIIVIFGTVITRPKGLLL